MTWGMIGTVGGSLLGGYLQGQSANRAADTTAAATREATALQRQMYEEGVKRQQPFYQAGINALPELIQASKYTPFNYDTYQQDPGVAFRLKTGIDALDRTAAARGGLLGGNQLRGAVQYGQELGSQEYTNAFNRYQTERAARLNPLQSLTGMGQTTANTIGNAGANYAFNAGNLTVGQGVNAANAGLVGSRAIGNAIGQSSYALGNYLNSPSRNTVNDMGYNSMSTGGYGQQNPFNF
jgi:hypothetical protein